MALPDRPNFFRQELALPEPRPGMRMAVRFHDIHGEPLRPDSSIHDQPKVAAHLSIEQAHDIHKREFEPSHEIDPFDEAAATVTTFFLFSRAREGSIDPRHERDIDLFTGEVLWRLPIEQRSILLDTPIVLGEALFPKHMANPNVYQFLLTRQQRPPNMQ